MQKFSMTDLAHRTSVVTTAADREIIGLTNHGRVKYVLMRVEEFDNRLEVYLDPRMAGLTADMLRDLADMLFSDLEPEPPADLHLIRGTVPRPISPSRDARDDEEG